VHVPGSIPEGWLGQVRILSATGPDLDAEPVAMPELIVGIAR